MKGLQLAIAIGGATLAGLCISMTLTNPGSEAYEKYATEKLSIYLKENVCNNPPKELPKGFGIEEFWKKQCPSLVKISQPQIKGIIGKTTERKNFFVFSIYSTELSLHSRLPSYHFETLGIFQNFYIYQAERL